MSALVITDSDRRSMQMVAMAGMSAFSHPPMLCIQVLEVQYCLHMQPSGVPVVSQGLSFGAYQHTQGTQWDPIA